MLKVEDLNFNLSEIEKNSGRRKIGKFKKIYQENLIRLAQRFPKKL